MQSKNKNNMTITRLSRGSSLTAHHSTPLDPLLTSTYLSSMGSYLSPSILTWQKFYWNFYSCIVTFASEPCMVRPEQFTWSPRILVTRGSSGFRKDTFDKNTLKLWTYTTWETKTQDFNSIMCLMYGRSFFFWKLVHYVCRSIRYTHS